MHGADYPEAIPMDLLCPNEEARIVEVSGDARRVHQLAEIGLRQGCQVRMIRPGQPCLIAIDGRRLSLRVNGDIDILVGRPNISGCR